MHLDDKRDFRSWLARPTVGWPGSFPRLGPRGHGFTPKYREFGHKFPVEDLGQVLQRKILFMLHVIARNKVEIASCRSTDEGTRPKEMFNYNPIGKCISLIAVNFGILRPIPKNERRLTLNVMKWVCKMKECIWINTISIAVYYTLIISIKILEKK